ncbi:unnamed protein product [Hyaloperonospora brassicae]|uniref:Nucleoplasmin-like domain-containing protein n=1 Tax=Hyaloperonospora brassicae TaxID=162125 RepID=A0AAV0U8Z2_HYABA|nr:unnamed protein product [Hyaloperonospora brassicae]
MVAFWGCGVTETKAVAVDVPEGFVLNVCNATCDTSSTETQLVVGLETQQLDGKVWKGAVAHLGAPQPLQIKLDLVFGHRVKFYLAKGMGAVNLTGYFQPGPSSAYLAENEDEDPSQIEATSARKGKKRAREEKQIEPTGRDEVSALSSHSKNVSEKSAKPAAAPSSVEKPKQKKADESPVVPAPSNPVTSTTGSAHKKKRKKKHKSSAASESTPP